MSRPMTKERLAGLRSLRREVTRTKRRLAELRAGRSRMVKSKQYALAYAQTLAALERSLTALQNEEAALLTYIEAVEDAEVRELLMLRYYDGVGTWQRVAFLMGEHDESYVRRKHNAFWKRVSAGECGQKTLDI